MEDLQRLKCLAVDLDFGTKDGAKKVQRCQADLNDDTGLSGLF